MEARPADPAPPDPDATYDGDGHAPDMTVTHHHGRFSFTVTLDAS